MVYYRPSVGALQTRADSVGDRSWNWANMTKYYQGSMILMPNIAHRTTENMSTVYDADTFGSSGSDSQQLHVSYPNTFSQYAAAVFSAVGLRYVPGFASGSFDDFGWWQFTIDARTGLRSWP